MHLTEQKNLDDEEQIQQLQKNVTELKQALQGKCMEAELLKAQTDQLELQKQKIIEQAEQLGLIGTAQEKEINELKEEMIKASVEKEQLSDAESQLKAEIKERDKVLRSEHVKGLQKQIERALKAQKEQIAEIEAQTAISTGLSEELEKVTAKAAGEYAQYKVDRLALEQDVQALQANVKELKAEIELLTNKGLEKDDVIARADNKYKEQQLELNKTIFELGQLKQSTEARIA